MKFTCTKENLSYVLSLVSPLSSKQNNLPILSNVLINVTESKVEFVATNLEIAARATLRAKVDAPGSFTVPAKTLLDYVHLLSEDQVEIERQDNELVIHSGSSSTKMKGAPGEDFPVLPEIEEQHSYVLKADILKESLAKTVIAVAKNEIRPELSGVYCGFFTERYAGLVLAATDSYRLVEKRVPVEQGQDPISCIIPARAAFEIIRLITLALGKQAETQVRLWVSENQIAMRYDSVEMTSRLIDGKYPDYAQIIPNDFKTTSVFPVDVMVNKIKAASLFTTTGINAVSFDMNVGKHTVGISSTSTQTGEHSSEIDAEMTGEENSILLNHRYVLDGLQHMEGDITFKVNGSDAPCLFTPKQGADYLYIVMPIRQ